MRIFFPIKKVNYKIKLIHDTRGNIKESLIFEIVTNSSITPQRSLQEGLKILIELFSSLFFTPEFLKISQKLRHKKIYLGRQKMREKVLKFFTDNKSVIKLNNFPSNLFCNNISINNTGNTIAVL
jgi:DNA-directed RNA polymerase alpha subunit